MEKKAKYYHKSKVATDQSNTAITNIAAKQTTVSSIAPPPNNSINPGIKKIEIDISSYPTEIRKDYLFDNYVIIAPKRHKRHFDANSDTKHRLYETAASPRLDNQTEIYSLNDKNGHWLTKVVDNLYPALTPDNPAAYGAQEIVIDTPLSNTQLGSLDTGQLVNLLLTYQERTKQLLNTANIKYVLIFKNEGFSAGASLAHSHTQIFALPIVPPRFENESKIIEAYFESKRTDPFEDIIKFELSSKRRIVWQDKNFIAFCPYASLWPMEVYIISKRTAKSVVDLSTDEISSLSECLKMTVGKLTQYEIDYNFFLQNGVSQHQRFSIKITPRSLNTWGGFEVATGIIINTLPPEAAAKWYNAKN